MGFLTDLIAKGKGLLDNYRETPTPTQTEAIVRNSFDRKDWEAARQAMPDVDQAATELGKTVDYVEDFLGDLHAMFLKQEPMLREAAAMDPSRVPNREVLAQLMEHPEVQALRQHSRGDKYGSGMAMLAMQKVVSETLHRAQSAAEEAEEARKQAEADRQAQAEALAAALAAAENGQGDAGDLQAKLDQFANTPAPDPSAVQQAAQQAAAGMENQLRNAAQGAVEDLDKEQAMMAGFGVEDSVLAKMSLEERMALAQAVRGSRLSDFAALLGSFKRVQRAEYRRKVKDAASEKHNVRLSNDFTRMATSEWLNLAAPELEMLMWKRWSQHALLTTDVRGRERQGRGPIIVVCDESSSMTTEDVAGGSREAWSKALSLALLDQAAREHRDFLYIGFANNTKQRIVEFPGGKAPIEKVMEMTEGFLRGGTHYEKPLSMALDAIKARGDKPRPDIVFLTDDEYKGGSLDSGFMRDWTTTKDKWSVKCYGIAIGCSVSGSLAAVSDNVRSITSLVESDPAKLADIFRTI